MIAQVSIGTTREFKLRHAVLVYGDSSEAFCTLHKVRTEGGATPYLEPAQPLTTAFLRKLAEGLGRRVAPEVLPENVSCQNAGFDCVVEPFEPSGDVLQRRN